MTRWLQVGGLAVPINRPEKILFPADGITKANLIQYYRMVAGRLLAQTRQRPLVLRRYPQGIGAPGFFQKRVPAWFPDWIPRVTVAMRGATLQHLICDQEATLVYLADQACVELHPWLAREPDLAHPDRIVWDLDPGLGTDLATLRATANDLAELCANLGIRPYLMTTGSRGFHVVVPLTQHQTWAEVHAFARTAAQAVAAKDPRQRTTSQRLTARQGRLFIDYLRNSYAQTSVAPYSVRALPTAPVAMPIAWAALGTTEPRSHRLGEVLRDGLPAQDSWGDFDGARASLEGAADAITQAFDQTRAE